MQWRNLNLGILLVVEALLGDAALEQDVMQQTVLEKVVMEEDIMAEAVVEAAVEVSLSAPILFTPTVVDARSGIQSFGH